MTCKTEASRRLRFTVNNTDDEWWTAADGTRASGVVVHADDVRALLAGHAAADTDATRKLARMAELAGKLKTDSEVYRGEPDQWMRGKGDGLVSAADFILAIAEE